MASTVIEIFDADINNIGVNVTFKPEYPKSALLYTNAQILARDILGVLEKASAGANDRVHADALEQAVRISD